MRTTKRNTVVWALGILCLTTAILVLVSAFQAGAARDNNTYGGIWETGLPWVAGVCVTALVAWLAAAVRVWRSRTARDIPRDQ